MNWPVPAELVAAIAVVAFVAWLVGRALAHQLLHAVELVAGYSSAALVVAMPAVLLAVAVLR